MTPVCTVVGNTGVGTAALVARLIATGEGGAPAETSEPVRWTVDTKYFTAEVEIRVTTPGSAALDPAPEAVVLTFDRSAEGTFADVVAWWEQKKGELEGAEVRLCVANNVTRREGWSEAAADEGEVSTWSEPGVMARCWDWCLQEGFEPVEVCTGDAPMDRALSGAEEPQGVRRVREALHSHMWPGLLRKDPPAAALPPMHTVDSAPPPLQNGSTAGPGEAADDFDPMQQVDSGEMEEEDAALERIMAQMLHARSAAQSNELSDEERRARAAELALRLAEVLSMGDESSDDEDA